MKRRSFAALAVFTAAAAVALAQAATRALPASWFDDDEWHLQVRYIITADELGAYRRVRTANEREDFISTFWSRRGTTFREEFDRRVTYANAHFAEPANPSHSGMDTERGRLYVMFGAPQRIDRFPGGAHEIWQYPPALGERSPFRVEFSVPPIDSCDSSYRILSMPLDVFTGARSSVEVFQRRFVTAHIPADFSRVTTVAHSLRLRSGDAVPEGDGVIFDGQLGPAGNDPLSRHFLSCRMFEPGGMGYTHPLAPGSYTFSTTLVFTSGETEKDSVAFDVN